MKYLLALPFVAALITACSHPLEIVGDGDIVSASGDRDCSYEDFQAAQENCTKNYVASAYKETYSAQPHQGWQFERWENYCANVGDNECSFDIPGTAVGQFWGQTVPPLRAVFSPVIVVKPLALTDTGIVFGGEALSGNNTGCSGATIEQQDCFHGRDATDNDDSDGHAGFSYTKLASDGSELPSSAPNWACVRDNLTGLVWEIKTDDGGIHDKDIYYRWGGKTARGSGFGTYYSDWDVLVDGSNNEALCGSTEWRVPSRAELESLVNFGAYLPALDDGYFPYGSSTTWTSSAAPTTEEGAWTVNFSNGFTGFSPRTNSNYLRLVSAPPL